MKRHICSASILLAIAISWTASAQQRIDKGFEAVAEVTGPQGTRSMPISFKIDYAATVEQAMRYRDLLKEGGQISLLQTIRNTSCGRLMLGPQEIPLSLIVADKTSDGWKYLVVTARTIAIDEVQLESDSLDYPFGVALFEVPDGRRGAGQLLTRAALGIDGEGRVTAAGWKGQTGKLKDVKEREIR